MPDVLGQYARDRAETSRRLKIVRAALGDARDVRTLSENDIRQYEARRRAGSIRYVSDRGDERGTQPVRQRSVQADVKLLKQVLYWACSVTYPDGSRLLERNPIEYVQAKGEHDVARPIASYERFEATRRAMQNLQERYKQEPRTLAKEGDRARAARRHATWTRAELALVLLEATGRRRGSIVGLRWSDFDFAARRITWRPDHDKKRKTWVLTYPDAFIEAVRDFQRRLGEVGGCLFPRANNPENHAPAELISQWIRKAEVAAGLPKLPGGTCHPYLRKWRSERRHLPTKPCAHAGGWSDVVTMERSYDLPDEADVLAVTSEPHKRRECAVAAN
jgi:integrase